MKYQTAFMLFLLSAQCGCVMEASVVRNQSSQVSDPTAPYMTKVDINGGQKVFSHSILNIALHAHDPQGSIKEVGIKEVNGICGGVSTDMVWYKFRDGEENHINYTLQDSTSNSRLCIWAKNDQGKLSQIYENGGYGIDGVNSYSFSNDSRRPPTISSIRVLNGNSLSPDYGTRKINPGDLVSISAAVADHDELPPTPLDIYVSINGAAYTQPNELKASSIGSAPVGTKLWTFTYSGYYSPSSLPLRFKFVARDLSGNQTIRLSNYINSNGWSVLAGDENIGDGASTLSARLAAKKTPLTIHMTPDGDLYYLDNQGLRRIDSKNGVIDTVLDYTTTTSEVNVPGGVTSATRIFDPIALAGDGYDLYIASSKYTSGVMAQSRIYRYNTKTKYLEVYAGVGQVSHDGTAFSAGSLDATQPADLLIWTAARITFDTENKDLYLINACSNLIASSSSDSVRIQKISQDPATKDALSVETFAGNCVKSSTVTSGANRLTSPLEGSSVRNSVGGFLYVPEKAALYVKFYGQNIFEIKNDMITKFSEPASSGGLSYSSNTGRLYFSNSNEVRYFDLSQETSTNTSVFYIGSEDSCATVACRDSGVSLTEAGVNVQGLGHIGDNLAVFDGSASAFRIKVVQGTPGSEKISAIAGTDRVSGIGADALSAKFARIKDLKILDANLGLFTKGIYILDDQGSRLLRVEDNGESSLENVFGAGISKLPVIETTLSTNDYLGQIGDLGKFAFSPTGELFWSSGRRQFKIDGNASTNFATTLLDASLSDSTSNRILSLSAAGYGGTSGYFENRQALAGARFDSSGNFFSGGYDSGWGTRRGLFYRTPAGYYKSIIGTTSGTVSADCTTPGCAVGKSISCKSASEDAGTCRMGPVDDRNIRKLYFAENNKIRVVYNPIDPTQSTLGTLVDMGREVGPFVYDYLNPSIPGDDTLKRIFYISSDGKLYCKDMTDSPPPATCDNMTALGPSSLTGVLSTSVLEKDANGYLYMLNSNKTQVLKYHPEN